jgi:ubiquinone/menaquinone biosynthesis C-methylase UbiE
MDRSQAAAEIFNKLSHLYQQKFMDVSLYADSLDRFCNTLTKDASVLELACGPGNITRYILNKRSDLQISGTDLAPNMLELAAKNNPEASFRVMDSRQLLMLSQKYDAIMCGFLLPYLSKEETIRLITDSTKLLKKNGVLYLSTMEDDYRKSGLKKGSTGDEIFMHYHEAAYLQEALKKNKFQIIHLERKKYSGPDGSEITDLIIIAELK